MADTQRFSEHLVNWTTIIKVEMSKDTTYAQNQPQLVTSDLQIKTSVESGNHQGNRLCWDKQLKLSTECFLDSSMFPGDLVFSNERELQQKC